MRGSSSRASQPERRDVIIDATLNVIADVGLAKTTHRKVASAAGVPLGSMTYYFEGLDDLLNSAFERLAHQVAEIYAAAMLAAKSKDVARVAAVQIATSEELLTARYWRLVSEFYAFAATNERAATVWLAWMKKCTSQLERHFSPAEARALDAIIEGVSMQNNISPGRVSRSEVRDMVYALTQ